MAISLSGSPDENTIAGTSSSKIVSENKKGPGEMVGGCSVCSDDQGTEENPLVYCDGCEVAVHSACYGIVNVPAGSWFCSKCDSGDSQSKIKCELCPSKDGALKRTEMGLWAHVVCALYIPEVRFGNNNTMEPIEIKHIQADRYNKSCYLCDEKGNSATASYGAVMDCHKLGCKQSFHVTCAQAAGLLFEEAGQGSDNVVYCGYCKHHFRKLKASNRKTDNSLTNSNSSYSDSASDSSQDNDSLCNTADHDKNSNRTKKLPTMPTNLSMSDPMASGNSHPPASQSTPAASKASTLSVANTAPISLTIPLNSTASNLNKTSSNLLTSPQKKKRGAKNTQMTTVISDNNSPKLAISGSLPNSFGAQLPTATFSASNASTNSGNQQDIYKWSNEKSPVTSKNSKKKQLPSTPSPNISKPPATSTTQSITINNYSQQKISSPNLSLASTSPALASPNSTKSTSNSTSSSSSTITTTSSSSSTSSNSPSPALLSPNLSNRGSTNRLESPLASNSKTGNNMHNRTLPENVPIGQNSLQARINLDNGKNIDPRKNSMVSSSLLSTAVPTPDLSTKPTLGSSSSSSSSIKADSTLLLNQPNLTLTGSNPLGSDGLGSTNTIAASSGNLITNFNTQPTVPPLVIPVPQSAANSTPKTAIKAKTGPKSTRKRSTEAIGESQTKVESKPKASRAKKTPTTKVDGNTPKPEPKKGKGRAASKAADTTALDFNGPEHDSSAKEPVAASPAKRKSRSTSNESTSIVPSPTKRPRKKKVDQTSSQLSEQSSVGSSNTSYGVTSSQLHTGTSNVPVGTSPLMINTPMMHNRLPSFNQIENGSEVGGRYGFSPIISPYASYEHTPSLSRASLSRLFTSSSLEHDNLTSMSSDDPMKAFEELRENTWNHLSKCVLEQAQQFDIPSLIGTLYTLRSENEKLINKVRDLIFKRDQLLAMNARLDLPGPILTQHLNNTSPNFSSVVSGLTNSPKGLPTPSPGSVIGKSPHVSVGGFNHVPPGSLGPPNYLDRSSPLVGQPHSGINNIKSSSISTPSPPIGALMAHSNSNRAGLITVNPPYVSNVYPPMGSLAQLGSNQQGSYFPRH